MAVVESARIAGIGGEAEPDIAACVWDYSPVCFRKIVAEGAICSATCEHEPSSIAAVKERTTTWNAYCFPIVTGLLDSAHDAAAKAAPKSLCESFGFTR